MIWTEFYFIFFQNRLIRIILILILIFIFPEYPCNHSFSRNNGGLPVHCMPACLDDNLTQQTDGL